VYRRDESMIILMSGGSGFLETAPRSDTLFGALCWGIRWIEGEPALLSLLARVDAGDPPFLVSSAFPYAEAGGGRTFFLPRPLLPPPPAGDAHAVPASAKALRRIRWVSSSLFNEILAGRIGMAGLASGLQSGELQFHLGAIARTDEIFPEAREVEVDRNAINRLTGVVEKGILFTSRVEAIRRGGHYCVLRPRHTGIAERIAAAFRLVADRGIGGDASVGRGHFHVTFEESEPFNEPPDGEALVTLSLFHPSREDLVHLAANRSRLRYVMEPRRGRLEQMYASHPRIWKPILLCLAEGSIFPPANNREIYGSAPVVLDEPFRVRQNGFAFPVRMRHAVSL
jgi:CRISPR-associated protein Csm4